MDDALKPPSTHFGGELAESDPVFRLRKMTQARVMKYAQTKPPQGRPIFFLPRTGFYLPATQNDAGSGNEKCPDEAAARAAFFLCRLLVSTR